MNLLRIAILNINYIRGLFPENYFNDKSVPALVMKIKGLMPMDAESRRMIDWMDGGVSDALQKKYLKTLLFCVCETVGGPMIEECAFSFSYSNSESQEVSLNVNRIGSKRQGGTFSSTEITPNQMRSSVCKIRALIQLTGTLDEMPEERTILMKLLYYDDVTPVDYEPQCFRGCTEEEVNNPWTKNPLKMVVGNVNSKHLVFALEVKSVLNPSRDDSDVIQDVDVSLGEGDASDLKTKPAASRESFAQVMENGRTNGNGSFKGESSSQSKRSRKASAARGRPYMDLILYSNKNNRDSLFEVFTNVSNDDSVFNTTKGTYPDEVYGMFICKDRVSAKTCRNCVTAAITQILVKCPLNNDAIIWFDKTTFSSLEKHPSFTTSAENDPYVCMSNQDQSSDQPSWFKEELLAKLDLITFKATSDPSNRMYAADIIETGLANFSGTVQCKSDLPEKDCFDCVSEAADRVKYCLPGKSEGIILTPNCSTRYELNPSHQSPCESKATACPCERRKREKIKDRDQCKCIRICIDGSAGILFVLLLLHKK